MQLLWLVLIVIVFLFAFRSKAKKEKPVKKTETSQIASAPFLNSQSNLNQSTFKLDYLFANALDISNSSLNSTASSKSKLSGNENLKTSAAAAIDNVSCSVSNKGETKVEQSKKHSLSEQSKKADLKVKAGDKKTAGKPTWTVKAIDSKKETMLTKETLKQEPSSNSLVAANPFDKVNFPSLNDNMNFSKVNRHPILNFESPAEALKISPTSSHEKPVHSILDYASISNDNVRRKPPNLTPTSLSTTKASMSEVVPEMSLMKGSPSSKVSTPVIQTQLSTDKWPTQLMAPGQASTYLGQAVKNVSSVKQSFHAPTSKQQKHVSQPSNATKPLYKTPPKDRHSALSVTPPKSSPQNASPHSMSSLSIGSSGSTKSSPLLHFPPSIEQARRLSGHSPEDLRNPLSISHSISR